MAMKSFLTCPHRNVQQFTEICLDCGFNVYSSLAEVREILLEEARAKASVKQDADLRSEIGRLEQILGRDP